MHESVYWHVEFAWEQTFIATYRIVQHAAVRVVVFRTWKRIRVSRRRRIANDSRAKRPATGCGAGWQYWSPGRRSLPSGRVRVVAGQRRLVDVTLRVDAAAVWALRRYAKYGGHRTASTSLTEIRFGCWANCHDIQGTGGFLTICLQTFGKMVTK